MGFDSHRRFPLALGVLFAVSCGPDAETQWEVSKAAIVNGQEGSRFPGVVSIGGCTATVVSPHVLLTAAHCLGRTETVARFGTYLDTQTPQIRAASPVAHPDADISDPVNPKHDVGV